MKKLCIFLLLCLLLPLTACGEKSANVTLFAMDTVMELTAYGPKRDEAVDAARQEINRLEGLLSAHREKSEIYAANRAHGAPVTLSQETRAALEGALSLCRRTGGALDVTIYPVMEAWGFPTGEYQVPDGETLMERLGKVDYSALILEGNTLIVPDGMAVDLGAVGKGYTGDRILARWTELGVQSGILNLGGNVQCLGTKPDGSDWRVAVRDPKDENGYLATVSGRDMAVVTSGGYQRYFERDGKIYHHIMDPATGCPAESHLLSATIVGKDGLTCDGLSTAVFVMGLDRAVEFWRADRSFDMILSTDAGELYVTAGLEGRVTPGEGYVLQVIYA